MSEFVELYSNEVANNPNEKHIFWIQLLQDQNIFRILEIQAQAMENQLTMLQP